MKTKLALWALKYLVRYVQKHPEFLLNIGHLIPGRIDDEALDLIVRLLKNV